MPLHSYWVSDLELPDGSHEVHKEVCARLPELKNCEPLGLHEDCSRALEYAKLLYYESAKGCPLCSSDQPPHFDPKL